MSVRDQVQQWMREHPSASAAECARAIGGSPQYVKKIASDLRTLGELPRPGFVRPRSPVTPMVVGPSDDDRDEREPAIFTSAEDVAVPIGAAEIARQLRQLRASHVKEAKRCEMALHALGLPSEEA